MATHRRGLSRRTVLGAGAGAAAALGLAACGGGSSDSGGSDGGAAADFSERGPITLAKGKDTTGKLQEFLDAWNTDHPDEKVTLVELPESSDEQRSNLLNNAQAKSDAYTVLGLDVVWTGEFAANQWVVELPQDKFPLDTLIPATVETATYFDKLYGVPFITNAELLFSRTDLLQTAGASEPPTTFEEMYGLIEKIQQSDSAMSGFGSQYSKYEGLTVNLTGVVSSAGGELFASDGTPDADSEQAISALQTIRDGFDKGFIPQEALTYKEEESRQAFQDGRLAFVQNWPYVWEKFQADDGSSQVKDKVSVSLVPAISGDGVSTLGGLNLGISAFAKNKGTAVDFIAYMVEADRQKEWALATAQPPAAEAVYTDDEVVQQFPFFPQLKDAIDKGVPRPQVVKYSDVTQAIQEAAYGCISGQSEAKAAMTDLQKKLTDITQQ